jgi:hypothetical protein
MRLIVNGGAWLLSMIRSIQFRKLLAGFGLRWQLLNSPERFLTTDPECSGLVVAPF